MPEEEASVSLGYAWMNTRDAENEFYSRVDSNFDEANITKYIFRTSDRIVDGDGYRPTSGCTL
jgi:hypothetical protein